MKRFFTSWVFAACCAAMLGSCSDDKYDDSAIRQEIENIKSEIAAMKTQISSLKTLVEALDRHKFITDCTQQSDGSYTVKFSDGTWISIRDGKDGSDGKDGADAPAIGIARNGDGVYCWTLGGTFILDDRGAAIPVAGRDGADGEDGATPTINGDGYWEIGGKPILDADGKPIKAVGRDGKDGQDGKDGDSFFEKVEQNEDEVIFTLANGETIVIPKAKEVNFFFDRTSLTLKYGTTERVAVTQKGVESFAVTKPDGWRVSLAENTLTVTAPAKENVFAERNGEISVVAIGATATIVAKLRVTVTDEILDGAGAGSSRWEAWN